MTMPARMYCVAPLLAGPLLAGCGSMVPPYQRPAAPVAESFPFAGSGERSAWPMADLRYRKGAANHFEMLDAQRSAFAARQAVLQMQLQQMQNLVNFYKVLGGGWKDAAPAVSP